MKKIFLFLILSCITGILANAQQEPQFGQNMYNHLTINPGYAGINDVICLKTMYRDQWVGFDGAPTTMLLNVDFPVNPLKGGLGLTVYQDKISFYENIGARLSYSYHWEMPVGKLGIGIRAGIDNSSVPNPDWKTTNTAYSLDNAIPAPGSKDNLFNLGLGLFYKSKSAFVGLSTAQLTEPKYELGVDSKLKRHYYLVAGYNYFPDPLYEIKPSILIKTEGTSTQIDLNCLVEYNNKFFGGVSYRPGDAIVPMIGVNIMKDLKLGYAYEITTSKIRKNTSGTHEIYLGYCFRIINEPIPTIYNDPRYLYSSF